MPHATPPHPRCAFRVAITGHRWDRLARANADAVHAQLGDLLSQVASAVRSVAADGANGYSSDPPDLVLLTGLAEGTDRIAARVALESSGWRVHVVLPFARDVYERDFTADGSEPGSLPDFAALCQQAHAVTQLDGPAGEYDAYVALGRVLVDQCDLLVCVWDGTRGRGPGGTANVVARARRDDVPIVRIDAHDPSMMWLDSLAGAHQGRGDGLAKLDRRIRALIMPPAVGAGDSAVESFQATYFREAFTRRAASRAFDAVVALFHQRSAEREGRVGRVIAAMRRRYTPSPVADPPSATRACWMPWWSAIDPAVRTAAFDRFAAHHGWADELAKWYAAEFRGSFTWVFSFAWVAVVAALLGALARTEGHLTWALATRVVEIVALALTLRLVVRGRRSGLHERWLEYRSLAERLRHLAVLWPMGRSTPLVRVPGVHVPGDPRRGWVGWMLRAVAREAGLAPGTWDAAACRRLILDGEIRPQREFHAAAMRRARDVHHPLERWAERFFKLALVLAVSNVVFSMLVDTTGTGSARSWIGPVAGTLLEALGVALPAFAASVHGFLGTSDLEGIALRSASIEPRLADLEWQLEHLDPVDTTGVGDVAVEVARAVEGELGTWRTVAASRPLQLG